MANISNYGSDVILEVPHSETYLNDIENQSVHAMQDFKQTTAVDFSDNEIHSDNNIIPYSQYLEETQQSNVQDTHLQAQQDLMILSMIEQMSREKMIDSQMDDMIREKLALKEQVDSLEQNLSKQIKEEECLLQTFTVFKSESKEKEDKYMENEIDLEKKIKELDNILFKVGYQNPFHLKKAQRIKPTLYDGIVMSDKHVVMPLIDDEETLILEEKSRSKMSEKAKDPEIIDKNRLLKIFSKRFTPQQELSIEQAFWLRMSDPTNKPSNALPCGEVRTTPNRLLQRSTTQEQADILQEIVEQAKADHPLDKELDFACKHAQRIQELLVYVRDTCPNAITLSAKKAAVTPQNKVKKVRFAEHLTSSSNSK
ncbi:hypothetical protein Tco_0901047 [Tanacetum coccineum]